MDEKRPPVVNGGECVMLPGDSTISLSNDGRPPSAQVAEVPAASITGSKPSLYELTPELIRRALLHDDRKAEKIVLEKISAIVVFHVRITLYRYCRKDGRDPSVYVEDYAQNAMSKIWEKKALLEWTPERGTANAYFGTITRNCVHEKLNSRNKNHQTETATPSEDFEMMTNDSELGTILDEIVRKDLLVKLYDRLMERGTQREIRLFDMIYRQHLASEAIATNLGLTMDTYFTAHSRLLKFCKQLAEELLRESK